MRIRPEPFISCSNDRTRSASPVTESKGARGFRLAAEGDFVGTGEWTFTPDGDHVNVRYDWRIRADKPLLRYGTFVFRPFFSANHRWAMAQGEESLKRELERRHSKSG